MIKAEELGALLFGIHTHADLLLKSKILKKKNPKKLMKDPEEIIYREEDLLKVLEAIGLPKPVWGGSLKVEDYLNAKYEKGNYSKEQEDN